jgi:hypothetical protein
MPHKSMTSSLSHSTGLMTVKYIYGPASVASARDDLIGSSISGRIETNVGMGRMTTIAMPMKGKQCLFKLPTF